MMQERATRVFTADDYIAKYIELSDIVTEKTRLYEEDIKQAKADMELMKNLLAQEINRLDGQSIKTRHGTAYRSTVTRFRVDDRETWVKWVITNEKGDMLTLHVANDAIKDYVDAGHNLPPGLTATTIHNTNIMRSRP
jgi:hypothetical protein